MIMCIAEEMGLEIFDVKVYHALFLQPHCWEVYNAKNNSCKFQLNRSSQTRGVGGSIFQYILVKIGPKIFVTQKIQRWLIHFNQYNIYKKHDHFSLPFTLNKFLVQWRNFHDFAATVLFWVNREIFMSSFQQRKYCGSMSMSMKNCLFTDLYTINISMSYLLW